MKNKDNVTINLGGKSLQSQRGCRLSSVLNMQKLCGGHGICDKCKIIASGALSAMSDEEKARLTKAEIAAGVRLACKTYIEGDCKVELMESHERAQILTDSEKVELSLSPSFTDYGVAVDIGTTTVVARLYDNKANVLAEASHINPQESFGADVVSRIEASLDGNAHKLAALILTALDELIAKLCDKAQIESAKIDAMVITGNTAMLHFLTESDVTALSKAPFTTDRLFGENITAKNLGLKSVGENTLVYLPRCISAFVGADTVCALIASSAHWQSGDTLLVDIGTNGEMALCKNGEITVCSTAAGPAFEGVGISCGMRGEEGAVDHVWSNDGEILFRTIGDTTPRGICGSGIIDAVAVMLENGILDPTGYMEEDLKLAQNVFITDRDIRKVQLAKSAICAGISTLLETKKAEDSVSKVLIAGGFGNYLNVENACKIGLLPKTLRDKIKVIGNAALQGASMLLLNRGLISESEQIADKAQLLPLHQNALFSEKYMENMLF